MRYRTSTYHLITLSALFILSSVAQAMFSGMNTDFSFESGNTLQEQTYLDNYISDYGNSPLFSVKLDNTITLSNTYNSKSLLDFKFAYYERIKTYVSGLGYVSRMNLPFASKAAFHGAVDYTRYDYTDFYQLALGAQGELANFLLQSNLYLPVGSADAWGGTSDKIFVGMKGLDFSVSKSADSLSLFFDCSYHWDDSVKDDISAASVGASYDFNQSLVIGAKYQYRHGLDSEDYGYKGYISIPLYSSITRSTALSLSSKSIKRQLGVLIQAVEDID